MNKSKYTNFLRSQLASVILNIKITLIKILFYTILLSITYGIMLAMTVVITYYYPEYANLLHGWMPIIMTLLAVIVLSPLITLFLTLVTKYQINSIREQSQEKISGMAHITIDDWTGSSDRVENHRFYVTVPDRQGRLWTFNYDPAPDLFILFKTDNYGYIEGEFPAEIYFREGIDSPSLVVLSETGKQLFPQTAPQMKDAPRRPTTSVFNRDQIVLALTFFVAFLLAGLLTTIFGSFAFFLIPFIGLIPIVYRFYRK